MPSDGAGELLVLLLDTQLLSGGPLPADETLQQVLTFLKAHLLLSERNQQCVMALHAGSSPILYCTAESGADPPALCAAVAARLRRLLAQEGAAAAAAAADGPVRDPALAAGLSRALCYIHRRQLAARGGLSALAALADAPPGGGGGDGGGGGGGGGGAGRRRRRRGRAGRRRRRGGPDGGGRRAGGAAAGAAARARAVLGPADSSFLQQAAHITGGLYLRPHAAGGLLQYLLTAFAADTTTRCYLNLYQPTGVDYRASCFCHKRVIDTGFICSVCLSIFCKDNMRLPACPTCKSVFAGRGGGGGGGASGGGAAAGGGG
ncbi:hypothetical protein Rsub_05603 [Raphidocelis subcapitata]|uniref:General transcription and DNA repair factor IIH subunit TFB4 n=1 Tax=Raphidocelis subcapitata TaxID=307507 RepID=A0A2V0NXP5_9CHLO|nr:hypothetical protein Rsub_05603 [Raphidocelis subcapitata]|eukprot:GBF92401.1 hypothetical protein Rsub_05603 [Raphidocelis subcapitata]